MNEKEDEYPNKANSQEKELNWTFCPICGNSLPKVGGVKYCTNCGVDLDYVKKNKELPPDYVGSSYNQTQQFTSYPTQTRQYYPQREVLSDEEIFDTKRKKLWGTLASIGFPLLAFLIMNGLLIGIIIILLFTAPSIIFNPIFAVFSILAELLLILLPLWYVKKYLKNPTLQNRLELLGFTWKNYTNKDLLKEILIGLSFAVVGIFLVALSSIGIRLFLEFFFGVRIIESPPSDAETLITGMDILILILMVIMMLVIVGPTEEILFRGFMQRGLVRTIGEFWGIIITAFIFAIIHLVALLFYLITPVVFFILFVLLFVPYLAISLMLGLLFRWRDENLIAVIITHGVYNSLTLIIAFLFMVFY
ncbi:MAG: CPBP family intramembrane metalloprotease [Promethearchaeota archaeon]|nr:MAG: CPBP family intramembrane metalloprotease [Candidatus Lokiarchaeota archaeon]